MTVRSLLFLLGLGMGLFRAAVGMEPLALLATQPAWQAGQPVTINVDYDGGQFLSICLLVGLCAFRPVRLVRG